MAKEKKEAVEKVMKVLRVRADLEEIRRLGEEEGRGGEMLLMKLKGEEQKRKIMRRKTKLRGRREKILQDWTWKERKMRWRLEEITKKEKRDESMGRIQKDKNWETLMG